MLAIIGKEMSMITVITMEIGKVMVVVKDIKKINYSKIMGKSKEKNPCFYFLH
jgi:hypothetical protein